MQYLTIYQSESLSSLWLLLLLLLGLLDSASRFEAALALPLALVFLPLLDAAFPFEAALALVVALAVPAALELPLVAEGNDGCRSGSATAVDCF